MFVLTDYTALGTAVWPSRLMDKSSSRIFISVLPSMPIDFHLDLLRQSGSDNGRPVPQMSL